MKVDRFAFSFSFLKINYLGLNDKTSDIYIDKLHWCEISMESFF